MLREFVPFDPKTRRPVWSRIDALVTEYANIGVPVLIVHGVRDETLSSAMGHALKDQIPGAVLVKLPGCGHCLPTEAAVECAKLIHRFAQGRTPDELAAGLDARVFAAPAVVMFGEARPGRNETQKAPGFPELEPQLTPLSGSDEGPSGH
jgi:fermentation-respiration switch protein FrsA (DUF1100 family)